MKRIALVALVSFTTLCASGSQCANPLAVPSSPILVAHRGLARYAPENTLAAYAACLSLRLGFETDIQRTQDGHLVILHDATVERTTNGKGAVADLALTALRSLDAGSWFHPAFQREQVPTLEEVYQLIGESGHADTLVAMDVKGVDDRIESDMVQMAKKHQVLSRLLFIGHTITRPEVRARLRAADAAAQIACLAQTSGELPAALNDPTSNWVYLRFIPTADQVSAIHRMGKRAFIAGPTVSENQADNWRRAAAAGADAFLTDEPLEARGTLKAKP